jgi:hypothetical protein
MERKLRGCRVALAVAVMMGALSASAEPLATKAVCAVQQALACGSVEICERALPAAVNLPVLMLFDTGAGLIESRHQSGDVRASKIASSSVEGEALILQGVDGGHPWAIRVNTKTGAFTLTVLHEDEGFLGFGVCSAKILKAPAEIGGGR